MCFGIVQVQNVSLSGSYMGVTSSGKYGNGLLAGTLQNCSLNVSNLSSNMLVMVYGVFTGVIGQAQNTSIALNNSNVTGSFSFLNNTGQGVILGDLDNSTIQLVNLSINVSLSVQIFALN